MTPAFICVRKTRRIMRQLHALRSVFVDAARANISIIMPGYTHMQRAQPVLLSHHLLAYYEMFTRDAERFRDALTPHGRHAAGLCRPGGNHLSH